MNLKIYNTVSNFFSKRFASEEFPLLRFLQLSGEFPAQFEEIKTKSNQTSYKAKFRLFSGITVYTVFFGFGLRLFAWTLSPEHHDGINVTNTRKFTSLEENLSIAYSYIITFVNVAE